MFDPDFILRFCKVCGRERCVCGPLLNGAGVATERAMHDATMVAALRHVDFGRFNQKARFFRSIDENGVRTARQRWWLTKLVRMHYKQHRSDVAVAMAEEWMARHPEPKQ